MSFKLLFSGDLRRTRDSIGWTQPFVADLVSITLREYQNIESGKRIPKTETFLRLVYLFDREAFDIRGPLSSV